MIDGSSYFLPKTALRFTLLVEKTTYKPGEFNQYAERYLKKPVPSEEQPDGGIPIIKAFTVRTQEDVERACQSCADYILLDNGRGESNAVLLKGPGKGLLLMPGMWREMVWRESGSVLCVLASEYYDPSEYIRNYDEFVAYSQKNRNEV